MEKILFCLLTKTGTSGESKRTYKSIIGCSKGKVWLADDFNEIPDGFKEYVWCSWRNTTGTVGYMRRQQHNCSSYWKHISPLTGVITWVKGRLFCEKISKDDFVVNDPAMLIILYSIGCNKRDSKILFCFFHMTKQRSPVTEDSGILFADGILIIWVFHLTEIDNTITSVYYKIDLTSGPFVSVCVGKTFLLPCIYIAG